MITQQAATTIEADEEPAGVSGTALLGARMPAARHRRPVAQVAPARRAGAARELLRRDAGRGAAHAPAAVVATRTLTERVSAIQDVALAAAREHGATLLRLAIGTVFVWFGALKILDMSPAAQLVADTLSFLPARPTVLTLGCVEVFIGLAFVTGRALRVATFVFLAQMSGTFLTFVVLPGTVFQHHNPLLLSMTGEFVMKNIVLVTGGLVALGSLPAASRTAGGAARMAAAPAQRREA